MPESTKPVITVLYHYLLMEEVEKQVKPALEKLGWEVLVLDDEISFNNSTINISAFYSLQKRDPNNAYTRELHKILFGLQIDKIERSDAILVYNVIKKEVGLQISPEILMCMTVANYLKKPMYTWFPHSTTLPYRYDIMLLNYKSINGKIEEVKMEERSPIGFLAEIGADNRLQPPIPFQRNPVDISQKIEEIRKKLQLKRKSSQ